MFLEAASPRAVLSPQPRCTKAIMDAEALGVSYQNAMANGTGARCGML